MRLRRMAARRAGDVISRSCQSRRRSGVAGAAKRTSCGSSSIRGDGRALRSDAPRRPAHNDAPLHPAHNDAPRQPARSRRIHAGERHLRGGGFRDCARNDMRGWLASRQCGALPANSRRTRFRPPCLARSPAIRRRRTLKFPRCPSPAAPQALRINHHEKERRHSDPTFASSPVPHQSAGRGNRRGLDGPTMQKSL